VEGAGVVGAEVEGADVGLGGWGVAAGVEEGAGIVGAEVVGEAVVVAGVGMLVGAGE
jgi:hypothetical protein